MRCAADPDFSFKLAVECGVDAMIIVTVNFLARRERFFTELEFVLSQVSLHTETINLTVFAKNVGDSLLHILEVHQTILLVICSMSFLCHW